MCGSEVNFVVNNVGVYGIYGHQLLFHSTTSLLLSRSLFIVPMLPMVI